VKAWEVWRLGISLVQFLYDSQSTYEPPSPPKLRLSCRERALADDRLNLLRREKGCQRPIEVFPDVLGGCIFGIVYRFTLAI
jgi:hypothetical protein